MNFNFIPVEPFPAIRSKLFASQKGFPLLSGVMRNYVIGNPSDLFLRRNWKIEDFIPTA